jgi:murein DD-endopeptidase MepM/ murein hydrolase activator NlpD
VIYVGSGVEGYGNLVLIRHPNGYVSAYAHLKAMSVQKGDVVNRGDNIGAAGMTGSVSARSSTSNCAGRDPGRPGSAAGKLKTSE